LTLQAQLQFFDHFLKGADNGMDDVPAVRLEAREDLDTYEVRYEEAWPVPGTDYRSLFLDSTTGALVEIQPGSAASFDYEPFSENATFTFTFAEETEVTGNMSLRLWVSTDRGSDMDLFVGVEKLDASGEEVLFYGKAGYHMSPAAMGWLRVSERAIDPELSEPWQPALTHERSDTIARNEIIAVDIEILPSSTLFRAGESLRLVIQGEDLFDHRSLAHTSSVNRGTHTIYTGGRYDSRLLVPVIR
jgi:putative CocE/NonD family hydrolase